MIKTYLNDVLWNDKLITPNELVHFLGCHNFTIEPDEFFWEYELGTTVLWHVRV